MADQFVVPDDKVMYYPNGIHDYITVTMLYKYTDRLVEGRYYAIFHTPFGGMFIAELNEARTDEEAIQHKDLVVNSFAAQDIARVYLLKCLTSAGKELIVQSAPFKDTPPFVLMFNDTDTDYITKIIH